MVSRISSFFIICFIMVFIYHGAAGAHSSSSPADGESDTNWVKSAPSYRSEGNGIAVDDDGNIYVTGNFEQWINFGGSDMLAAGVDFRKTDIFIAKYNPQGEVEWVEVAGGVNDDGGMGIAVCGNNVYVTGFFSDIATFSDTMLITRDIQNLFIVNFDKEGRLKWAKQAKSDGVLKGQAITTDSEGNVYVTGNFRENMSIDGRKLNKVMDKNIYLAKLDSMGTLQWLKQASGGNSLITYVYVHDIACDKYNNVYIAGEMMGPVRFEYLNYKTKYAYYRDGPLPRGEIFLAKYSKNGKFNWLKETGTECRINDLHIDDSGNFLITGYFKGAVNGNLEGKAKFGTTTIQATANLYGDGYTEDIYLAKYDKDGQFLWVRSTGSPLDDRGLGVGTDSEGFIYLTGYFTSKIKWQGKQLSARKHRVDSPDIFISKFTPNGEIIWLDSAGSKDGDDGRALAIDRDGNVYVTGTFQGEAEFGSHTVSSSRYNNFFLAKYAGIR